MKATIKKVLAKVSTFIKRLKSKKNKYYLVAWHYKYSQPGSVVETVITGYPFASREDAEAFAKRNSKDNDTLKYVGILEVATTIPMTYAVFDATITPSHPKTTVVFEWPEGVDTSSQAEAESNYIQATATKRLV